MIVTVVDLEYKITDSYAAEIEQVSKQIDFEFETFKNITKISFKTMDDPTVEQIIQQTKKFDSIRTKVTQMKNARWIASNDLRSAKNSNDPDDGKELDLPLQDAALVPRT
uniref:Uncharacterized protein n=1 Tax=Panagrolaimus sp. JU765 TaxID=591449 RepID=A0AC34R7N7_9BILA